jgi:catechol 2,3-dioxygenase-like lactoylglutathione lyase family enzyme
MTGPGLSLLALTVDGDDEQVLADFYAGLTGSPVDRIGPDGSTLSVRFDGLRLVFRRVEHHRPPTWPSDDVPMQMHLEVEVDDLERTCARLLALGATLPAVQPHRAQGLLVLLDPAGHPFCIARPANERA